jgi:hypothetical protein
MKNIHVLPTDKPSRLYLTTHEYIFEEGYSLSTDECENKNIYITSDEEIKEGDWYISILENEVYKATKETQNIMRVANLIGTTSYKQSHFKIILTTDQDLIKDGVWGIEDGFLEWFVKNPTCDYVELKGYAIILPGESCDCDKMCSECEPKQETLTYTEAAKKEERIFNSTMMSKQETLEEASDRAYSCGLFSTKTAFIAGAKWKQEKMYSEEDMRKAFKSSSLTNMLDVYESFEEFIEQFKKK